MAARRPSAAQIRDRRARIAVVVLGAMLLLLGVVQGPKILKMFKGGSSPEAAAPAATGAGADASVTAVTFSSGTAASGPASGQLNRFTLLAPKDPFHSQDVAAPAPVEVAVTAAAVQKAVAKKNANVPPANDPAATVPAATVPPATVPPAAVAAAAVSGVAGSGVAGSGSSSGSAAPAAAPPVPTGPLAAVVKMNGNEQTVPKGGQFPLASPLFRIVAVGKKRASIGLVTGSFADGTRTLKITQGHKLTLVNNTDGSRYELVYVEPTRSAASPTAPAATPTTTPTG